MTKRKISFEFDISIRASPFLGLNEPIALTFNSKDEKEIKELEKKDNKIRIMKQFLLYKFLALNLENLLKYSIEYFSNKKNISNLTKKKIIKNFPNPKNYDLYSIISPNFNINYNFKDDFINWLRDVHIGFSIDEKYNYDDEINIKKLYYKGLQNGVNEWKDILKYFNFRVNDISEIRNLNEYFKLNSNIVYHMLYLIEKCINMTLNLNFQKLNDIKIIENIWTKNKLNINKKIIDYTNNLININQEEKSSEMSDLKTDIV